MASKTVVEPKKKQKAKVYYDEHLWDIHSDNFMLTRSLCVYYRLTGHEPALELAGKLVRGVLKRWKGFEDDGRFLLFHFHTGTASLLAILEYAMITKDSDLIEFVTQGLRVRRSSVRIAGRLFPGDHTGLRDKEGPSSQQDICRLRDLRGGGHDRLGA